MALKDEFDKSVHNAKDAINEAKHRSEAEAEKAKREVADDSMTATEKVGSVLNEAKKNVEAGADHLKRDVRDKT
jgi:sugar-specific transcriptional regulator TrmB